MSEMFRSVTCGLGGVGRIGESISLMIAKVGSEALVRSIGLGNIPYMYPCWKSEQRETWVLCQ